ncbi:MAG: hypothetical protein ACRDHN_16370 [Thermomicrobiales bacterium]
MNSQLLPASDLALIQLRIDERVADAARRNALRGLRPRTGPVTNARRMTADFLLWFGQRVRPTAPTNEPGDEHVLIPLAR